MALYSATTLNTNILSQAFNQLANRRAYQYVRNLQGFLYKIWGKPAWRGEGLDKSLSFENLEDIRGNQIEVKANGVFPLPSFLTDGAAELAVQTTPSYANNLFDAQLYDIAHLGNVYGIPGSEMDRIQGPEAKTDSFVEEVFAALLGGVEVILGDGINGTGTASIAAPARGAVGSWAYAVDDGTTYSTYGQITRSDSTNVDFRSTVDSTTNDLSTSAIRALKNTARGKGSKNDFAVCDSALYGQVQGMVEAQTLQTNQGPDRGSLGFESVSYGQTEFVFDQRSPVGNMLVGSSDGWKCYTKRKNLVSKGFMPSQLSPDGYVLPYSIWFQLICTFPKHQAKFSALNA